MEHSDDDIRLIYIGSANRALAYGQEHMLPPPVADQIVAATDITDVQGLLLPPWCHIATELHRDADGIRPALPDAHVIFEAALSRRRKPPAKAST